jgi:hypothetical protein
MVISESDVEKCKAQAPPDTKGSGTGDTKGGRGEDMKGTTGAPGHY